MFLILRFKTIVNWYMLLVFQLLVLASLWAQTRQTINTKCNVIGWTLRCVVQWFWRLSKNDDIQHMWMTFGRRLKASDRKMKTWIDFSLLTSRIWLPSSLSFLVHRAARMRLWKRFDTYNSQQPISMAESIWCPLFDAPTFESHTRQIHSIEMGLLQRMEDNI